MWKDPSLVGIGAATGASVRYLLMLAAPDTVAAALFTTVLINAAGCFAMGLTAPGKLWGMGFLGGFTTFSAVSVAALPLGAAGAAALLALSFTSCIAAWWAGDTLRRTRIAQGGFP
ncbi:CrcB family protein [Corynebacterium sp. LK2510]|uniref:CrcB family protein n=1 Tax=Corynebacterium sp. LK2510 TaxID=3110472 RepID=UPI0034CD5F39